MEPIHLAELLKKYKSFMKVYHKYSPDMMPKGDKLTLEFSLFVSAVSQGRYGLELSDSQCAFILTLGFPMNSPVKIHCVNS